MAKPTVATVIKWLRLRGEQDRADAIEQRISELEHPVRQARMNAEKHLTTVKASAEYLRMQKRIRELEVDRDFWKSAFKKRTAIMDQQEGRIRELLAALAALRGENDE